MRRSVAGCLPCSCIVLKRLQIRPQLLWNANRKLLQYEAFTCYHFQWPRVTLSNLPKYSMARLHETSRDLRATAEPLVVRKLRCYYARTKGVNSRGGRFRVVRELKCNAFVHWPCCLSCHESGSTAWTRSSGTRACKPLRTPDPVRYITHNAQVRYTECISKHNPNSTPQYWTQPTCYTESTDRVTDKLPPPSRTISPLFYMV